MQETTKRRPVKSAVLTVSTLSYVPQALATLRSARACGAHDTYHLFVADALPAAIDALRTHLRPEFDWVQVAGPHELGLARERYLAVFSHYNAFEVCNVAKYVAIDHVLRGPSVPEFCVYTDSDIFFLRDCSGPLEEIGDGAVLLTPHQFGPTSDACEHDHISHGWINSGFSVYARGNPATGAIVEWLTTRISRRGYLATQYGLSGDQPWLSAVPFVFANAGIVVSRDTGLNVAYWNLDQRELAEGDRDGAYTIQGVPLTFFHFSGYDRLRAMKLSKHGAVPVAPGSPLERLCRTYDAALDACEWLRPHLAGLPGIPSSRAKLPERLARGMAQNSINLTAPTLIDGVFTKVGRRLDAVVRRVEGQ